MTETAFLSTANYSTRRFLEALSEPFLYYSVWHNGTMAFCLARAKSEDVVVFFRGGEYSFALQPRKKYHTRVRWTYKQEMPQVIVDYGGVCPL